jgi:hypothetical protein
MAMMVGTERKPLSMLPSPDETHSVIGDFTKIPVSNSDNSLHLIKVSSA